MITVLAGGGGAAKFLRGLIRVVDQRELTIVVNTGDDEEFYGLYVCPDLDIITYALAGTLDEEKWWGLRDESYHFLESIRRYGEDAWFSLGDRDLATHVHRTLQMRRGLSLTEVVDGVRLAWGIEARLLPMTDSPVRTRFVTPDGVLAFQDYFVRRQAADHVQDVFLEGAEQASPAPGLREAIMEAERVLLTPSNPIISIGTILSIPGIRDALKQTSAPIAAISPIVGGASLKGPSDRIMMGLGLEVSAYGVAKLYQDFLDLFVIDSVDAALAPKVEELGVKVLVTNTVMHDNREAARLAEETLEELAG